MPVGGKKPGICSWRPSQWAPANAAIFTAERPIATGPPQTCQQASPRMDRRGRLLPRKATNKLLHKEVDCGGCPRKPRDKLREQGGKPAATKRSAAQDGEAIELLAEACTLLAQARVPTTQALAMAAAQTGWGRATRSAAWFPKRLPRSGPPTRPRHAALPICAAGARPHRCTRSSRACRCPVAPQPTVGGGAAGTYAKAKGEQGDPLPLHYVSAPDDTRMAFVAGLYVITSPARARAAPDETVDTVEARCSIASNLGKTRVIAAEAGPVPSRIAELGEEKRLTPSEGLSSSVCAWGTTRPSCRHSSVTRCRSFAPAHPQQSGTRGVGGASRCS